MSYKILRVISITYIRYGSINELLDKHIAIGGAHGEAQKIKDYLNGGGDDHHHIIPGCCSIKI
jgi:hypothetical protein